MVPKVVARQRDTRPAKVANHVPLGSAGFMPVASHLELLSDNRMTAIGALDAGCRFFSGYLIPPSSEIYQTMMEELPVRGGVALAARALGRAGSPGSSDCH